MSESLSLGDLGYPTVETVRRAEAYHRILTDLIAELRDAHADGDVCSSLDAADRAEARLREVGGDE